MNRREFIAGGAAASFFIGGCATNRSPRRVGANDKVNVAIIGCGCIARSTNLPGFLKDDRCRVTLVCDVIEISTGYFYEARGSNFGSEGFATQDGSYRRDVCGWRVVRNLVKKHYGNKDCRVTTDWRDVIDDPTCWRYNNRYGGGMITDFGAHEFDELQRGLGMQLSGPVAIENMKSDYGSGTDRDIRLCRPNPGHDGSKNHESDFLDGIFESRQVASTCEMGHRTISIAHIANICARMQVEAIAWDPKAERFKGPFADEANRFLACDYHNGWELGA